MRSLDIRKIREAVAELCIEANLHLRRDVLGALKGALAKEKNSCAREILSAIIKNAQIASGEFLPLCQDTGMAVIFISLGRDVRLVGGRLEGAINSGLREGSRKGYLRNSIVGDPLLRKNTNDNTPAIIHYNIRPGDKIRISVLPKGFGAENASRIKMFKPTAGTEEIEQFVIDTVREAGGSPCPPLVLGIGIGGTMEYAALLAKEALLRPIDKRNPKLHIAKLEVRLFERLNKLDIGPMGLGGKTTVLGVNILTYPTHIAGLPVALNVSCHSLRSASRVI